MSHDIIAKYGKVIISHLSIGAFNDYNVELFYDSLDAQQFNNGVSGNGDEKEYTIEQIKIAKSKLIYIKDEPIQIRKEHTEARSMFLCMVANMFGVPTKNIKPKIGEIDTSSIEKFYDEILNSGKDKIIIDFS